MVDRPDRREARCILLHEQCNRRRPRAISWGCFVIAEAVEDSDRAPSQSQSAIATTKLASVATPCPSVWTSSR